MGILIIAEATEESPSLFSSDQLFEQVTCRLPVGPKCPNAIIISSYFFIMKAQ